MNRKDQILQKDLKANPKTVRGTIAVSRLLEQCSSAPPCDLEEMRSAMMQKRDAQEASAEQAAQELLADEVSTKPPESPVIKGANTTRKLRTEKEFATTCPRR